MGDMQWDEGILGPITDTIIQLSSDLRFKMYILERYMDQDDVSSMPRNFCVRCSDSSL